MISRAIMSEYSLAIDEYFENQQSEKNGWGNVYVGNDGQDTVVNYANGSKILTGNGNDTITSTAGGVDIEAGDGEDEVIALGFGTDLDAGAGDDMIYAQGGNIKIEKGTGSDTLYVQGFNIEIAENKDDVADTIKTPSFLFQYIKNQGLILDDVDRLFKKQTSDDDDDDYDVEINIYNN